jgi:hypothetical protein
MYAPWGTHSVNRSRGMPIASEPTPETWSQSPYAAAFLRNAAAKLVFLHDIHRRPLGGSDASPLQGRQAPRISDDRKIGTAYYVTDTDAVGGSSERPRTTHDGAVW